MRKTTAIILAALLLLTMIVSCNHEEIVDEAFTFTITFSCNDPAYDETAIQKIGKGIPIGLKRNPLKREGYVLIGWNTEADGSGTYYSNGQRVSFDGDITLYANWAIAVTSETTTLTDGNTYSFDSDVINENRITVNGNVTLALLDGYTLTSTQGITVNEGNNLTIDAIGNGTGTVNAVVPDSYPISLRAAIGGEDKCNSGLITINGGNVNATSGMYGAAIGGGDSRSGNVIINGGNINAKSGMYGAAIGGGWGGSCGAIVINGGTVNAASGLNGAAIGYGYTGPGGGTVVINGGTVTATAGKNGAGIGGCYNGSGVDVTINGGQVLAIGGDYNGTTGIGKGSYGVGDGTLTLGEGVSLLVGSDNVEWSAYDGTTRQRYMKTN